MKKITTLFVIILIFSVSSVFAGGAFEVGSKSLSGGFSYTHLTGDAYYDTDLLELTPALAVCVSDGVFVGGIFQVRYISQSTSYNSYSDTQWQIGITLDRYFVQSYNSSSKLFPFFKVFTLFSNDESVTQLSFGGQVGFMKMMSDAVGLDFGIKGVVDRFSANSQSVSGFTMEASIGVTSFIF